MATFYSKSRISVEGGSVDMKVYKRKYSSPVPVGTLGDGGSSEGLIDRFSSLPDSAAYHVLRYLNVADLSQLIQVSTKCKKLCESVPFLMVDNWDHLSDSSSLDRYMRLVKNFLDYRCKIRNEVKELNFNWNWKFLEETRSTGKQTSGKTKKRKKEEADHNPLIVQVKFDYIWSVINYCGIESAILRFVSPECRLQELDPRFFFCVPNLKELTVSTNLCRFRFHVLYFPMSTKLQKLTLWYSKLNDEEVSWIVASLTSLKELYLYYCIDLENLTLQSKSLEHLKIVNLKVVALEELKLYCPVLQTLFVQWFPHPDCRTAFIICSPELKEFVWHGFPRGYYYAQPSVHLLKASIHLQLPSKQFPCDLSRVNVELLDDVIDQLKTAKSLAFHGSTIRFFRSEDCSLSPLSNVESVAIMHYLLTDKQLPAMAFFLKEMLSLKSLSITSCAGKKEVETVVTKYPVGGFKMKFWEAQGFKFLPQLKEATIEAPCGNGVELVKYLLKYGTALETMKIVCFPGMESSILEQIEDYNLHSTGIVFSSI